MPQIERGLYEPGEDVRVFDGSEEEDVEGSRLPLLIVLALLVLAMFAGFVWLAYSEGVARGRSEIPVITAEGGPARVAPANPGGATTPYKGFKIYEQPAPPDDETAQTASPREATDAKPAAAAAAPKPAPAAKIEAAANKPTAMKAADAAPQPKPAPAAKTPAPAAPSAPLSSATAPPKQLAAASPPALATKTEAPPAPAAGAYVLQIGAYKSQGEADAAWNAYKAKHAALLAGYAPNVVKADLGDKGTWYRLRIAGFSSKDVASGLCDRLKADGGGCFLGK